MLICDVVVMFCFYVLNISYWKHWLAGISYTLLATLFCIQRRCCTAFRQSSKLPILTSPWHLPPQNSPLAARLLRGAVLCKPCDVKIQVDQRLSVKTRSPARPAPITFFLHRALKSSFPPPLCCYSEWPRPNSQRRWLAGTSLADQLFVLASSCNFTASIEPEKMWNRKFHVNKKM